MKKLLFLACLMAGMLVSCSSDDGMDYSDDGTIFSKNQETFINTSWKFYGFGSIDGIREVKPSPKGEDAYIVNFQKDGIISGSTSTNDFYGEYNVQGSIININHNICTTKAGEVGDGYEFISALLSCSEYLISDNQLKLYYDKKQKYLMFTQIDSSK